MKVILCDGVTHEYERGWQHHTRCGLIIEAGYVCEGTVDCLDCLGGPSHLSNGDLVRGREVQFALQLLGPAGSLIGKLLPCTMSYGANQHDVEWLADVVTTITGVAYCHKDGTVFRVKHFEPLHVRPGDTFNILRGKLRFTET